MSQSFGCKCKSKIKDNWVVIDRNCNYSYFEYPRGQKHYSDYSTVYCKKCGALGRTKANYVKILKNGDLNEN